ncbi:MAG: single-stranded DNA-binding protein [Nitrospinaceae bacterium]|jgi:single-strand DNA-binding protein|nr:single-stranded DNA-binding protein [Nitrospinaceae bacterium]MDP6657834.1 single-stranded DNA-binding protein [Nitrospinaceae bacterium]MDP6711953.1 single-stranded DNA-binding protein [Nitrospinaceae bacterium]HAK37534.1 single-stranded DNA-binding protein [Nitrospina sp.]|tara:strand:+ start:1811 stop:2203 length:393 start_codon:yes stop_codon:yes gene_type:complete
MASFNKVMLMGNLTRDPELRYTANGSAVTSFGLAVNRKFKQGDDWKEDVCFVDITVWGKQGENCAEYLSKGRPVFVEGRLQFSSWESDGQKRNKLDVVANTVQFLGSRGDSQGGSSGGQPPASAEDDVPF